MLCKPQDSHNPWIDLWGRVMVYSLILIVHHIYKGDADARLFGLGFTCATMTVAYDVLGAVGIVPRVNLASSHLGQGLFVLMLGLILVRRFRLVHMDLITAKTALLDQVDALASRNAEIELLNAELRHQIEARSRALVDSLIDSDHKGIRANLSFLTSGETINKRYRVIRVLGQGAMGVVYEVERLIDKRHLAAKVLSSHAGRESLARFVREAQLLAHLDHPNLVKITDVDITDQRVAYIVMELVNGTTLAQQHARYRDLSFVLPVLRQVADALAKVHSEGIVHRDLKPANMLVALLPDGSAQVKLVDFGVSALLSAQVSAESEPDLSSAHSEELVRRLPASAYLETQDQHSPSSHSPSAQTAPPSHAGVDDPAERSPSRAFALTQTGMIMGTPLYMAPELAKGAKLAKPSSDVFGFGVIAYELLTGRRPSENPPMLLRFKPGKTWFMPLRDRNPNVPNAVAVLIERCLEVNPSLRPTAEELVASLRSTEQTP